MKSKNTTVFATLLLAATLPFAFNACKKHDHASEATVARQAKYHCPMHPTYTSDKPGECPICGMRLVPIDAPASESTVPGQATVQVNPERQQLIGVQVEPVEIHELTGAIRASARVAYDPDLYNAIYEHQQVLATNPSPALIRSSELRLRQMGLSPAQIKEVSRAGYDPSNLLLSKSGDRVWVYIDIYDFEAPSVKAGQKVDLTSSALPGKVYPATIRSVDTVINSETRTLRARADALNADGGLRPEMYLNAVVHVPTGKALAVPETAVIDTGTRQLVYVEKAPGEFEPRAVVVGKKAEGFYEVVSGIKAGERVVTSANFLIDSESKLKGAVK